MPKYKATDNGYCPYSGDKNYDHSKTEIRRPGHSLMYNNTSEKWSVRVERNGRQYPLQNPTDKNSQTATIVDC